MKAVSFEKGIGGFSRSTNSSRVLCFVKIKYIVLILVVTTLGYVFYIYRDQTINFADQLPDVLIHCDDEIMPTDEKYRKLAEWLRVNNHPWIMSPVDYLPDMMFSGEGIEINVRKDSVVVNTTTPEAQQLVIETDTSEIFVYPACD